MTIINTARPVTRPVAAWRDQLPTLIRVYGIILTLVLLVAVVGIGNPAFLSAQNIFNMLSQWAPAGIMAVGMTFVILTGGFDLSVASGYSLCAVVAAYVGQSYPPSIAFAAAIVVGLLFGLETVCSSQWSASIPSSPQSAAASLSMASRWS
jgi:ribose transport system permease protein